MKLLNLTYHNDLMLKINYIDIIYYLITFMIFSWHILKFISQRISAKSYHFKFNKFPPMSQNNFFNYQTIIKKVFNYALILIIKYYIFNYLIIFMNK